jgi:hypothetical protein
MACPTGRCSAPRHAPPCGRYCAKRRRRVPGSWMSSAAMLLMSHCRASLRPLREACVSEARGRQRSAVRRRQPGRVR